METTLQKLPPLERLRAREAEILDELAGITRMIAAYTDRVSALSPALRAIRKEIRRIGSSPETLA
jgi:hypothetical protein